LIAFLKTTVEIGTGMAEKPSPADEQTAKTWFVLEK
jgi:hypothetical protein